MDGAVMAFGVLGALVGAYLPGVVRRVPADLAIFGRPERERSRAAGVGMAVTAPVYAAVAVRFGLSLDLPAYLYLGTVGVALAAIDLRHRRLPDALTLPSYPIGALLLGVAAATRGDATAYLRALAAMAAAFALYEAMHVIYPAGMGFGDVKLAGLLGLHLGWLGWDVLIAGVLLGFLAGGAIGVGLLLSGRATRRSSIPYGPFMLVGAFVAILWGHQLAEWYAGRY